MSGVSYTPLNLPEYVGNPLIEALPPMERSDEELLEAMAIMPHFADAEREGSIVVRREMVSRLKELFIPLPPHFELFERVSTCLRRSYTWRNPIRPQTQTYLHHVDARLAPETMTARAAAGSALFVKGVSGIGKSRGIEACLRGLGPSVLYHEGYHDAPLLETQIVWLKLNCPEDRSLKSLCIAILTAVDDALGQPGHSAEYVDDPRMPKGTLIRAVRRCLADYHVGVLVVDELQNLFASKGQPALDVLNFLLRIREESGICMVLCGTYASLELLQNKFRLGRRLAVDGVIELMRSPDGTEPEWIDFCEILWNYQWLAKPTRFSGDVAITFHDLTQAIRGLAVPLFMRAQEDAMGDGTETLTCTSLRATWRKHFNQLDRALAALRANDPKALAQWDDLCDANTLAGMSIGGYRSQLPMQRDKTESKGSTQADATEKKRAKKGASKACADADPDLAQLQESNGLEALRETGLIGVPAESAAS